jgi:predicted GIY-YIG superfamily endonuclease
MNVLQAFDKCKNLWEDTAVLDKPSVADDMLAHALNKTKSTVRIKGQSYEFITPFLPVDKLCTEDFAKPGIYIWRQESSNAYYVGQAVNIQERTRTHSKAPVRDSKKLHNAIRAHGTSAFTVAVIEFCSSSKAELNQREVYWIDELDTFWDPQDFNLTPGGEGGKGGTLTFEDFKVLVTQLQNTGPDALTFAELESYWKFKPSNMRKINSGKYAYIREYAETLGISFPIRPTEDVDRIARSRVKTTNPQYKTWNLVVTYAHINSKGKYEPTGSELLGTFRGHDDAWDALCEIERTKYGTSEEDMIRTCLNFYKGNRGAACFEEIAYKRFARRYTLEEIK